MEGRAQRFFAVFPPVAPAREAWSWLGELAAAAGQRGAGWESLDGILRRSAEGSRACEDTGGGPAIKLPHGRPGNTPKEHRESGRTSMTAHIDLHEPKPARDNDSPLAFTMEGRLTQPPSSLIPRFWAPGWNSDQSLNKFQMEVGGALRGGDPGVRIVEPPAHAARQATFRRRKTAGAQQHGTLLLVARHHVFGSEELSALSPGDRFAVPRPVHRAAPRRAAALGLKEGQPARGFCRMERRGPLPLRFPSCSRASRTGWPACPGVPGMPLRELPVMARVSCGRRCREHRRHRPSSSFWASFGRRSFWPRVSSGSSAGCWACSRSDTAPTGRAVRRAPGGRRHAEDLHQGELDPAFRGQGGLRHRPCHHHDHDAGLLCRDPHRPRRPGVGPRHRPPVLPGHVLLRRVQRRPCRLGVQQQVLPCWAASGQSARW